MSLPTLNYEYPGFENVHGLLDSQDGRDLQNIIEQYTTEI